MVVSAYFGGSFGLGSLLKMRVKTKNLCLIDDRVLLTTTLILSFRDDDQNMSFDIK